MTNRVSFRRVFNSLFDRAVDRNISPVFIAGCSHSGTTLMMSLLARHPDLYVVPFETGILFPENSFSSVRKFYQEQSMLAGNRRIVEKTPRHIFELPRLFRLFPAAQVIVMLRDGRDVAVSIRRRKGTLDKAVQRWLAAADCLETWKNDPRLTIVRYENLVVETKRELSDLMKFLGTSVDINQLLRTDIQVDFRGAKENADKSADQASDHLRRRREQINRGIYDDRGRWLTEMTEGEKNYIQVKAGAVLNRWGYS